MRTPPAVFQRDEFADLIHRVELQIIDAVRAGPFAGMTVQVLGYIPQRGEKLHVCQQQRGVALPIDLGQKLFTDRFGFGLGDSGGEQLCRD